MRTMRLGLATVVAAGAAFLTAGATAVEPGKVTRAEVDAAIAKLDASAAAEIASGAVPGLAIAVVFKDEMIFARGYGLRDVAAGAPVDAETVFQIASVSKSVGSTVVAALVGEGLISWDSRISDLDPAFALNEPWVTSQVTIRDLYAHRSGLGEHAGDLLEDIGYDREQVLHRLRFLAPASSFRSAYAYTNFGMTEGGVAAAKAYGLDWETASEEKLYTPLGMTATSSRFADFWAHDNKALGHEMIDGKWTHVQQREPDGQSPAGGVSSNVIDLARWMRLQMDEGKFEGRQIVASEPLAETHLPVMLTGLSPLNGLPGFYGLGWNVSYGADGRHKISHSGAFSLGTGTNVNISLDDDLGVVVLTNGSPTGVAEALAATFLDDALHGAPTQDWLSIYKGAFAQLMAGTIETRYDNPPAGAVPAAANSAYVGDYANDYIGDASIIEQDGGLALVLGPGDEIFPLTHFDRDTFSYMTPGEGSTGRNGAVFTMGPDGKATDLSLAAFAETGAAVLTRK